MCSDTVFPWYVASPSDARLIYRVRANLDLQQIEALVIELGAEIRQRRVWACGFGSPTGTRAVFHLRILQRDWTRHAR